MGKTLDRRIAECVSIRTQLQSYGIFSIPDVATKIGKHMNNFVKNDEPQTFTLKSEGGIIFRIILSCKEGIQSGVEMIK